MNIETCRNYCISKMGVTESFPFPSLPNVLVFKVADKMVTATDVTSFESISLQCNSEIIDELRAQYPAITKHKYFSGKYWNLVHIDNSISDKTLQECIDNSYELLVKILSKSTKIKNAL